MNSAQTLELIETNFQKKAYAFFPETSRLNRAINYSLLGGGKRIRPLFCLGFSSVFKGNQEFALNCAFAVEMIHTYSLIHDDLPAMDNDSLRRGKPTNHIVHGEAQAILAGDALLNFSPEFLLNELLKLNTDPSIIIEVTRSLLAASGHEGMIKGQSLDMDAEHHHGPTEDLSSLIKTIHENKTGKLIEWSCLAGLYSTSNPEIIKKYKCHVKSIGQRIGLLFQIIDDVMDVVSSAQELGKTPGKDIDAGKLTYTNLYGIAGAQSMAKNLAQEIHHDMEEMHELNADWSIIQEILKSLEAKLKH